MPTIHYFAALLWALAFSHPAWGLESDVGARLPVVGKAPDFTLTAETGAPVRSSDLNGKVVAVTFIYTSCRDTCPVVTAKLASLQRRLGPAFGSQVRFVSITVDPEVDTPDVLRRYAHAHGADKIGWSFLTGSRATVDDVVRGYGAFARKSQRGNVDHLFLTSLLDRSGLIRVQYLGYRFDPDEMLADMQALLRE